MCYSIRVETSLDALQKKYPSTIDYQLFLRIYEDRSRGIANLKIPKGIDQNFLNLDSLVGEKIRSYIWNYNKQKTAELEQILIKKTREKNLRSSCKNVGVKLIKKSWR